jgi:hypothetical protein
MSGVSVFPILMDIFWRDTVRLRARRAHTHFQRWGALQDAGTIKEVLHSKDLTETNKRAGLKCAIRPTKNRKIGDRTVDCHVASLLLMTEETVKGRTLRQIHIWHDWCNRK